MASRFLLILFLKALIMVFLILFAGIGLGPDETQYWTWSRHLDFGYYSKPPGIAWQIFAGTFIFGQTELGVRFGSVILGTLLSLAVYKLTLKTKANPRTALYAGGITALSPFGVFATFFAITDVGMLLFWTLGLIEMVEAIEGKRISGLRLGLWIALGSLFKWPIFLLLPIAFFYIPFRNFLLVSVIAFTGLLPTLYWNAGHDWATFKHVWTIAQGGPDAPSKGNPLEFFGAQAAILSPLLFLMLLLAWFKGHSVVNRSQRFLGTLSLLIFALYFGYAFFKKVQGNWALYLFPPAIVFLAVYWGEVKGAFRLLRTAIAVSLVLLAVVFLVPFISSAFPWKMNPFKHNLGWDSLEKWIATQPQGYALLADKYQTTSILSFYNVEKKQAFFMNLQGMRKNQFSFWPQLKEGEDALFFVVENSPHIDKVSALYPGNLKEYFDEVSEPELIPLIQNRTETVKAAICYRCHRYNGKKLDDPEKY